MYHNVGVATYARFGVIFNNHFTANLPENQPVKRFWQSVKIWHRYHHECGVSLFMEHGTCVYLRTSLHVRPSPNFHSSTARSSSGSVAIRYVLPVLWITSCLHIIPRMSDAKKVYIQSDSTYGGMDSIPRRILTLTRGQHRVGVICTDVFFYFKLESAKPLRRVWTGC